MEMQHMGEDTLLLLIMGNSYFFPSNPPSVVSQEKKLKLVVSLALPLGEGGRVEGFLNSCTAIYDAP